MKLVQLLFLAFALPMFLSMRLFSLVLVFVSTFRDRYYGGGYQYNKCPLSCSIFLFLVSFTPVSLSSYCSFAPSFALYFFQTPSLCPCFWEWPFFTPRGKSLVFQPLQERLQKFCWRDCARGMASEGTRPTLPTGICFSAAACSSVVKDFCAWQIKLCMYIAAFFLKRGSRGVSFCASSDCVQHTRSNLLCDGWLWDAQSRAGSVPVAEREACCHTFVWEMGPTALGESLGWVNGCCFEGNFSKTLLTTFFTSFSPYSEFLFPLKAG